MKRKLVLSAETLRYMALEPVDDPIGPAETQDVLSTVSAKQSCQGTRFCCKPPVAPENP